MSDNQAKNSPAAAPATAPAGAQPTAKGSNKPKPNPKPGKDAAKQLQPLHSYPGTVGQFAANPDGVLDRFQLETAGQAYTVQFPTHLGQELLALAQPGHAVAVLGFLKTSPKGDGHPSHKAILAPRRGSRVALWLRQLAVFRGSLPHLYRFCVLVPHFLL